MPSYVYDDPIRNDILSGVGLYHSLRFAGLRYHTIFMDKRHAMDARQSVTVMQKALAVAGFFNAQA